MQGQWENGLRNGHGCLPSHEMRGGSDLHADNRSGALICPLTDKICTDPDCKESGCLEEKEDEGEEELKHGSS
jgi:hypothetical protein